MQTTIKIITATIFFTLISGCAYLHSYVPSVQQGNIITQKKVNQLKVGMRENQVRVIMGTPVLVNTFSENHWNYVYTIHKFGDKTHHKRLIVTFKNRRVTQVKSYL